MSVAILVPRRADGGRRDQLFEFVRKFVEHEHPDFELIEGHHDDGGLFNRSAAVNSAARQTDADVLVVMDGDVIVPPAQLTEAVELAASSGRAVLAYGWDGYTPLNSSMTDRVLDGYDGRWDLPNGIDRGQKSKDHISSCVVVPRALFWLVGGMDERYEGWGPEDRDFHHKLLVLGGGVLRVPGKVFHLHHPFSPERNRQSLPWLAGDQLKRHCWAITDPTEMRRRVSDAQVADGVLVVFVGNGRADCLARAIASFDQHLTGPVVRRVLIDDSGDFDHHCWIRLNYPDIDLIATNGRAGFDGAYRKVWDTITGYGLPWAFVIEEDFTAERQIDLAAMQQVMNDRPHLAQMALRRQAWFPKEIEAGGVVELHPDEYTDEPTHLEHRLFFTTNPTLLRRSFVTEHPWPKGGNSEARFAGGLFKDPALCSGYWGARTDAPWVIHDGPRTGRGY